MLTQNVEAERQMIDSQIHQLRLQISDLCVQRNALATVSCLPTELMTIIFVYARDGSYFKSRSETVMSISWVCRRWRQIALDWPCLWSDIDFDHTIGIQRFIKRSKEVSLYLCISHYHARKAVLKHAGRFRAFRTAPFERAESPEAVTHLDLGKNWVDGSSYLESLILTEVAVPQALSKAPPPLSELSLVDCLMDWSLPLFSSHLTTLSVTRPAQRVSVRRFLDIMTSTPALESLFLDGSFEPTSGFPQLPSSIKLLSLKSLAIQESATLPVVHLLSHLSLSEDVISQFSFDLGHGSENGTSILVPYYAAHANPPAITWMEIRRNWQMYAIETLETCSTSGGTKKTILMTHPPGPRNPLNLPHNLDLSHLKTVDLRYGRESGDGRDTEDHTTWSSFGHLPNLTTLKLGGEAAFSFFRLLAEEGDEARYDHPDLLPENLRPKGSPPLRFTFFRGYLPGHVRKPVEISFKALREVILDFKDGGSERTRIDYYNILIDLRIRKEMGFGLSRLEYYGLQIAEEDLVLLKEVVDEVEKRVVVVDSDDSGEFDD